MNQIQFGNSKIEYKIIKSNKRKTIGLTVSPQGVLVRSPTNVSPNRIKKVVYSRAGWIKTKQIKIQEIKQSLSKNRNHKNQIPYLGKHYAIEIRNTRTIEKLYLKNGKFFAYVKPSSDTRKVEQLYISWLKSRATKVLEKRVLLYKKKLGVNPSKILIKNQKMRWASATKKSSLNFNWNILKAPIKIIDYVVVHELCHLRIHNHSSSFWNLVHSIIPDYESRKEWLRINGLSFTD